MKSDNNTKGAIETNAKFACTKNWSSRKAWLKITTLVINFLFLFPPKKKGRRKGEWIANIVILSHAFLLDPKNYLRFDMHQKYILNCTKNSSCVEYNSTL